MRDRQRMYKARLPNLGVRKYRRSSHKSPTLPADRPASTLSSIEIIVLNIRRYADIISTTSHGARLLPSSAMQSSKIASPAPDDLLWQNLYTGLALIGQGARLPPSPV